MSKVVVDGVLMRVSPSQLKTYQDCKRKWWYGKVAGIPEPKKPHLDLGTAIHKQFEDWYDYGTEPTHESVLAALRLPEVPQRDPSVIIEEPRDYGLGVYMADVEVKGRIDVLIPPVDGTVMVLDWKSTSSWDWLKTPEMLARDAQGIIYLKYAFKEYPQAHTGLFRHVYARTRGGKGAKAVTTDPLTRDYIDDMYGSLERVVEEMKVSAAALDVEEVPPSTKECEKYGGCPYRHICPAVAKKTSSILDFGTEEEDMTLAEKLKAMAAQGINPPDAAKSAPVAAPTPRPAPQAIVVKDTPAPERPTTSMVFFDAQGGATVTEEALHLYVNCRPTKNAQVTSLQHLEDLIADRTPGVLEALKAQGVKIPEYVLDVRQVPYGAGTAAMAASFRKDPPTGAIVARTGGVCDGVLDVLIPLAASVVVGT